MGLRVMTSSGDVNSAMPMIQGTAKNRFKPWKSPAFSVMLTVVLVTFTPTVAAKKEQDSAMADRSTRDVATEVNPRTRDVAVAPSDPGQYKIEYTGYTSDVAHPDYFPGLDYGLMGYDSLKGFPLSIGHDPGFTRPIFTGNYSGNPTTADGLWFLPKGVIAVPDESCVTSFTSEVIKSSREFSRSMKARASVSGGGWGVSFSASAGYQEASSVVSSGEYVLIISKANCDYYFMKLLPEYTPPFHPVFVKRVIKLNNSNDENDFIDFFDKFGTHFVNEVKFGASFTYEHKMSRSNYETMSSSGFDVSVAASYSGLFSVSGEASYSEEQKQAAADFNSKVTTKTITIGSPPPENGDALTWASSVMQNPLPVRYDLTSIEELFSETFMGPDSVMGSLGIDYRKIKTMITATKRLYCERLQSQGLVNDCSDYISGLTLEKTKLAGMYKPYTGVKTFSDCFDLCYNLAKCDAVDFCDKCSSSDSDYRVCRVYVARGITTSANDDKWAAVIRVPDLTTPVRLFGTTINGVKRALSSDSPVTDIGSCSAECAADEFCVAFTLCKCPDMKRQCTLYSDIVYSLTSASDSTLYFVPPGLTFESLDSFQFESSLWPGTDCLNDAGCISTGAICLNGRCITAISDLENAAVGKPAKQRENSEGFSGRASNAVDGNPDTDYFALSCSMVYKRQAPFAWWYVDLGDIYEILGVSITNRGDCCPGNVYDLSGAVVEVFQHNPESSTNPRTCYSLSSVPIGATHFGTCTPRLSGRYVRVRRNSFSLTMCEVEVWVLPSTWAGQQ
ncbi:hypothetical protein BaRGS_00008386 [Batillaria attramentaria]|uniref:MACPF domain-containing protein n=1 Tax=Batillaria attramentaria TaxID=370345 RepID=A0ABD0LLP1_9CAEN